MAPKKGNFSGIINRLFIIFLLFTFMVTTGSFLLRHTINVRLHKLRLRMEAPSSRRDISALLIDLDLAENSFQKASADGTSADLLAYQRRLDTVFRGITRIIDHYQNQRDTLLPQSRQQLATGLKQKLELSRNLYSLRKNFDSLLRVTTIERIHQALEKTGPSRITGSRADTLVSTRKEINKSGLISRLKEALHGTRSVRVLTVREKNDIKAALSGPDANRLLGRLNAEYARMAASAQALVMANLNLLTKIRDLTKQLQDMDSLAYEQNREATLRAYAAATHDLNTFVGVALVAVLVFIILLLIYVRRAGWAERRLRIESGRAIKLAGQKSEILAIMSHEIRNKLMAINGAVFTLRRTNLSDQQEQKVSAINLSSGLVLETVNNVLDASKLEQGYAETRKSGPFQPGEAVTEAVEAMRFMAENKSLQLQLTLGDGVNQPVYGDSFRLKQFLLNLLSNAIKYTEEGFVRVEGTLTNRQEQHRLTVTVSDSGLGIPKHLQAKLFTPYYQAEGQKPGTGLGLYLCRQLIRQQGGEITIESEAGKGTVISFFVDYHDRSDKL